MLKKKIYDFIENIVIDMDELESARWDRNIYGVEPQYAVGGWDYDEDEYFEKQVETAIEWFSDDGIGNHIDIGDAFYRDEENRRLTDKAIGWIEDCMKGKKKWN